MDNSKKNEKKENDITIHFIETHDERRNFTFSFFQKTNHKIYDWKIIKENKYNYFDSLSYISKVYRFKMLFFKDSLEVLIKLSENIGDIKNVMRAATIYDKDDKKRLEDLKEELTIKGYRIFTEKQLGSRYWGSGDKLKEDLKAGKIVEAIDICDMASQRNVKTEYRWLNGKVASSSPAEPSYMVARLCGRSANIENNAQRKSDEI